VIARVSPAPTIRAKVDTGTLRDPKTADVLADQPIAGRFGVRGLKLYAIVAS
jgi:hypothetical protein